MTTKLWTGTVSWSQMSFRGLWSSIIFSGILLQYFFPLLLLTFFFPQTTLLDPVSTSLCLITKEVGKKRKKKKKKFKYLQYPATHPCWAAWLPTEWHLVVLMWLLLISSRSVVPSHPMCVFGLSAANLREQEKGRGKSTRALPSSPPFSNYKRELHFRLNLIGRG